MRLIAPLLTVPLLVACVAEPEQKDGRFGGEDLPPRRADEVVSAPTKPGVQGAESPAAADSANTPVQEKATATTCQAPRDLGAIAGDEDSTPRTERGSCSEWLRIRVTEASTGAWPTPMKLNLTLSSPPGADFDLHVYMNKESDVLECTKEEAKSELSANRTDGAKLEWGEYWSANGSDDQRAVSIEVRAKDPASCGKGEWVLLIEHDR